jgi:small-conductance mechanosensitive channel
MLEGTLLGIQTVTLVTSAGLLVAAAAADALLRRLVRRKVRRDEAAAESASPGGRELLRWLDRGLRQVVAPLALLIWISAVYGTAAVLLRDPALAWMAATGSDAIRWTRNLLTTAALFWLLVRGARVIDAALTAAAGRTSNPWDDVLLRVGGKAARLLLPLLALILGIQALSFPPGVQALVGTGLTLVFIGTTAFLLYESLGAGEQLVLQRYRVDVADNLRARAVFTQVTVLKKIATAVIVIFTVASMLMVFESVRQFGTSILASAGIAGIIIGLAAQRSIATLLAGFQIAVTQPIRLDDVVIVENEWGRVEDITLTYVTVKIWDERRLVVPITYFLERPFQNWTRTSSQLLATVFLHVDYRVRLDAVREELTRILRASAYWDGRVNVLQVTEAREHTLEIRALASAADASLAWDLRCELRERLVTFLQQDQPESLPRVRAELQPPLAPSAFV